MKNLNIPIYRAKKIDSDEYVKGYLDYGAGSGNIKESYYINNQRWYDDTGYDSIQWEIDPSTLAIKFEDMLDSEGNEIFASLSEDGKNGDKFLFNNEIFIVWFDNQGLQVNATNKDNFECNCHDSLREWYDVKQEFYDLKVIGIQK